MMRAMDGMNGELLEEVRVLIERSQTLQHSSATARSHASDLSAVLVHVLRVNREKREMLRVVRVTLDLP